MTQVIGESLATMECPNAKRSTSTNNIAPEHCSSGKSSRTSKACVRNSRSVVLSSEMEKHRQRLELARQKKLTPTSQMQRKQNITDPQKLQAKKKSWSGRLTSTVAVGPNLLTRRRLGERYYSSSTIASTSTPTYGETSTLESDCGTFPSLTSVKEKKPAPTREAPRTTTVPVPFKLSTSDRAITASTKTTETEFYTLGEQLVRYENRGCRESGSFTNTKPWKGVTVPNPPKLLTSIRPSRSSPHKEDKTEESPVNPFKARAIPKGLLTSKGEMGIPKSSEPRQVTTPEPFHLSTSQLTPRHSETIPTAESTYQFRARPLPGLTYRAPKVEVPCNFRRKPTAPEPFHFNESKRNGRQATSKTTEELMAEECAHQFKARPMPKPKISPESQPVRTKTTKTVSTTVPTPFRLSGSSKRPDLRLSTEDIEAAECANQFRARRLPKFIVRAKIPETISCIHTAEE